MKRTPGHGAEFTQIADADAEASHVLLDRTHDPSNCFVHDSAAPLVYDTMAYIQQMSCPATTLCFHASLRLFGLYQERNIRNLPDCCVVLLQQLTTSVQYEPLQEVFSKLG